MPIQEFIKYLGVSTIASIVAFFLLDQFLPLTKHMDLLWWSIICFVILSSTIYFLVERSMKLTGGKGVIDLVIFNVLIKLVFSFGFVALYVHQNQPQEKLFIVPFLMTYLVFTVFETWFLNLQARGVK